MLLDQQLREEERMVRDSAYIFAQDKLAAGAVLQCVAAQIQLAQLFQRCRQGGRRRVGAGGAHGLAQHAAVDVAQAVVVVDRQLLLAGRGAERLGQRLRRRPRVGRGTHHGQADSISASTAAALMASE